MLIDKVLSNLDVRVEPFALCLLSSGWRLSLPGPPSVMLHFVLEGRGVLRGPDGRAHQIAPYWLAVVPRGARHSLEADGDVKRERRIDPSPEGTQVPRLVAGSFDRPALIVACGLVRVLYRDSLGIFDHLDQVLVVDLSEHPQVSSAFRGILAEQSRPGPGSDMMQTALMSQCLVELFRSLCSEPDSPIPWLTALDDPALARALGQILENPARNHTVDSLAEVACMSRSTFVQHFTATIGLPPMKLVHHIRMQRAARLLTGCNTMKVDAVAHLVGLSSRSNFSRAFKKHYGVTPMEFRSSEYGGGVRHGKAELEPV